MALPAGELAAALGFPGRAKVGRGHLVGCPPHLDVRDQRRGRARVVPDPCRTRRGSFSLCTDLVGELCHEVGTRGQIAGPQRMMAERCGDGSEPGERSTSSGKVVEAGGEDGGRVASCGELVRGGPGEGVDAVALVCFDRQELGEQCWPGFGFGDAGHDAFGSEGDGVSVGVAGDVSGGEHHSVAVAAGGFAEPNRRVDGLP